GVVCLELRFDKFVAIEIHERDLAVCKLIAEACLVKKKIRVAMVTGPFCNGHGAAPTRRKAWAAAPISRVSVFTGLPGSYSIKLGLSRTDFPRTFRLKSPRPS